MNELVLVATGDSIIARRIHGIDPGIAELSELIRGAHAAFTNLELVTPREPMVPSSQFGGIHLGMPPFVLDELRTMGFNLYNLAHNHAIDFMLQGLLDTMEELGRRGMVYAGAGRTLGEARSPAYLDTAGGRVALIAAASTFCTGAHAADPRPDFPGRPGINPLRYRTTYVVSEEQLRWLQQIDEAMGTVAVTRRRREFGLELEDQPDAYRFLGSSFVVGDQPGVRTAPNETDLKEICRWISDAARQADLVVVSLHAHEGRSGDSNTHEPADFIIAAAHAFVDAGADVVVGHGPHVLRGIEIYRGKPIFYSLGNFMFMCENIRRLPGEMYQLYRLPATATPADVFDFECRRDDGAPKAFHADWAFWETVMPVCRFRSGGAVDVTLQPVSLGLDLPRARRGAPRLADPDHGRRILALLDELSAPFGARIDVKEEHGRVVGVLAGR